MTPAAFKQARHTLGLTAQQLADRMQLGKGGDRTVRRWETGERAIPGPVKVLVGILVSNQEN